jgi:hypothetical protein
MFVIEDCKMKTLIVAQRAITHRDDFIVAQALIFALDVLRRLPEHQRPGSNIDDMKAILAELPITVREMAERDTGRWLLLGAFDRGRQAFNAHELGPRADERGWSPPLAA